MRYVVVGDGPERSGLERLAANLGLRDAVVFTGRASVEEVNAWYHLADVFAMPARSDDHDIEGFGIVFLEAAAAGKPVVAGRGGGVGDAVVDGVTGLLIDPSSEDELANALRRLLLDQRYADAMGEEARRRVMSEFGPETFCRSLNAILAACHSSQSRYRDGAAEVGVQARQG